MATQTDVARAAVEAVDLAFSLAQKVSDPVEQADLLLRVAKGRMDIAQALYATGMAF